LRRNRSRHSLGHEEAQELYAFPAVDVDADERGRAEHDGGVSPLAARAHDGGGLFRVGESWRPVPAASGYALCVVALEPGRERNREPEVAVGAAVLLEELGAAHASSPLAVRSASPYVRRASSRVRRASTVARSAR
jgi:hypothetical protein